LTFIIFFPPKKVSHTIPGAIGPSGGDGVELSQELLKVNRCPDFVKGAVFHGFDGQGDIARVVDEYDLAFGAVLADVPEKGQQRLVGAGKPHKHNAGSFAAGHSPGLAGVAGGLDGHSAPGELFRQVFPEAFISVNNQHVHTVQKSSPFGRTERDTLFTPLGNVRATLCFSLYNGLLGDFSSASDIAGRAI
jgi:hypothetical protein